MRILVGFRWSDENVYYRLVTRAKREEILEKPRYWRFLRIELPKTGVFFMPYDGRERIRGESEYPPMRLIGRSIDGLLSLFSPLRLAVVMGSAMAGIGLLARLGSPLAWILAIAPAAAVFRYIQLHDRSAVSSLEVVAEG